MTMSRSHATALAPIRFVDLSPKLESFESAALKGLTQRRKSIPYSFLYDRRGSELFDRICTLPEYYPTRTETAILRDNAAAIAAWIGPEACVAELGSGSSTKTRIVLDALERPAAYVPIDVSREHLRSAAHAIAADYPDLDVIAVCADYSDAFALPDLGRRRTAFFPGSTIGNLNADEALALMRAWRKRLGDNGQMLLGADLRKDAAVLEAAYDDDAGVTRAFIKNVLVRLRRELGADIDPADFAYRARYNAAAGRVEMHLLSRRAQRFAIAGRAIALDAGEAIHIENSHKYTMAQLRDLAEAAGFAPAAAHTDGDGLFSVHLWSVA